MRAKKSKIVYSTRNNAKIGTEKKQGRTTSEPPSAQQIRVMRDKKRRRGKTVTVATGFQLTPADLKALQKTLKQFCGAGGTVKDNEIEIQGDHREKVAAKLTELGYKVKFSGG